MSALLYNNVVPLDRNRHRNLKLRSGVSMKFAAGAHCVPLAAVEMFDAARDYPIFFAGSDDATPVAVLGLRSGENVFVDADGRWADAAYVPAFIRRYPFVLARAGESSDFTVCLDESFEGFSEAEGTPLFDEEGQDGEVVSRALGFLKEFLTETERTRRFVERLRALDLLGVQSLQVKDASGRTFALRDFRMIEEKKVKELGNDVLGDLHRSGYLGCIYAHLLSLGNLPRLAARVPVEANVGAPV
ncbi:MAG TPA: SapC family protein [Gammaproteobacteria bacterium]|nr:SapC family protein [Gammaproteobacteria bacterium]